MLRCHCLQDASEFQDVTNMKNVQLRLNEIWYLLPENADYFWRT